ncbi:MAG TPA: tRNA pseudouridine(38-40) synthase TruA [Thermoanaerobaculia bacterium]|nr:tRNA pseudouridine(38-40) synthase TruA [Thermoanaerobaculia bacterium]
MRKPEATKVATYRLLIEYDGTRYSGWQEQRNARTVAGALLHALGEAGFPVAELGGAGRTDAGVHALGQCAHLRLEQRVDPDELCRALNRRLPRDVHVLAAVPAPASFHARHDAVARSYLYQISRRRTAHAKPWVWWVREPLDVDRLRAGAALLAGRHDFRNFAEPPTTRASVGQVEPGRDSTLVEVESVEVVEDGALVVVRMVASHFLWKMVRRLIGTLTQLGAAQLELDQLERLLEGAPLAPGDPRPAQWTAPPSGLFLERVLYAGDPPLAPVRAITRVLAAPTLGEGAAGAPDRAARRGRRPARPVPRTRRRPPPRRGRARPG